MGNDSSDMKFESFLIQSEILNGLICYICFIQDWSCELIGWWIGPTKPLNYHVWPKHNLLTLSMQYQPDNDETN